jgi:hypothetical protein
MIKSFLTNIAQKFFDWRIECEIYDRLFPHLNNEADLGYPFHSNEALKRWCLETGIQHLPHVQKIDPHIDHMAKGYSLAFRYIFYREMRSGRMMSERRLRMFENLALRRNHRVRVDHRFVATRAEAH